VLLASCLDRSSAPGLPHDRKPRGRRRRIGSSSSSPKHRTRRLVRPFRSGSVQLHRRRFCFDRRGACWFPLDRRPDKHCARCPLERQCGHVIPRSSAQRRPRRPGPAGVSSSYAPRPCAGPAARCGSCCPRGCRGLRACGRGHGTHDARQGQRLGCGRAWLRTSDRRPRGPLDCAATAGSLPVVAASAALDSTAPSCPWPAEAEVSRPDSATGGEFLRCSPETAITHVLAAAGGALPPGSGRASRGQVARLTIITASSCEPPEM